MIGRMRLIWIAVCLGAIGAGVAAFLKTRGNELDPKKADQQVKTWAEKVAPVKQVDCPEAKMTPGTSVTCKVQFVSGEAFDAKVSFKDKEEVDLSWATPIIGIDKLTPTVVGWLKDQAKEDVKVDCGKGVVPIPAEGLVCKATDAKGETANVRVKYDAKTDVLTWNLER